MSQALDLNDAPAVVILRLLSGALRGGEFALGSGTTLFVVGPPAAFHRDGGQPDFPENALFVPVDEGGGNFEVDVTVASGQAPQVALRDLNAAAGPSPYIFNTVLRIGGLDIAMRPQEDVWSDEVLRYSGDAPAAVPQEMSLPPSTKTQTPLLRRDGRRMRNGRFALFALLLTALAALAAAVMFWPPTGASRQAEEKVRLAQQSQQLQMSRLSVLLTGAVGQYRVVPGCDGFVYIFAADDRDAGWARQAVARSALAGKTRVVQESEERARIVRLLGNWQGPLAYHVLRLDDPSRPALLLSLERAPLDAAARQALAHWIAGLLPYADAVSVEALADAEVLRRAEAGLTRLGVRHRTIEHAGSTTMSVHGRLADGELQKIRTFAEAFYRQWGSRYVHFSVEMEDDRRKGKSFKYGGKGYLKSAPSHWDFSV